MDNVSDPTDFRDTSLQQIDRVLRCDICKDLYNTPMQLQTCIHSFCALCIRRRLAQERVCPSCKTPADEKKLTRNSVLEECVNAWRDKARQLVITLESGSSLQPNTQPPVESIPSSPKSRRSARLGKQPQPSYRGQDVPEESAQPTSSFSQGAPARQPSPPPVAPATMPTTYVVPDEPASGSNDSLTQESVVECPLCRQSMKQVVINEHIDRCISGDSSIPEPPRQFFRPPASSSSKSSPTVIHLDDGDQKKKKVDLGKKPTSLIYDMIHPKEMKKILRDLGLSDAGDKQQMIWRHKEYKTLYEANMDAEHPKNVKMLRRQLNEAENAHNAAWNTTQAPQVNIEEHNARYKDQFSHLIELARKRPKSSDKKESKGEEGE